MKKLIIPFLILTILLCGCSSLPEIDAEAILTKIVDNIDWEELQDYAKEGYDALAKKYPALEEKNIKSFLKDNGLELMNKYVKSTGEESQANAAKLGQIIVILYPDLADEVEAVLPHG